MCIRDSQNAYDALQEANISLGLISDLVTATPIDYGISIAYRSVMGVEIPKITYHKQPMVCSYNMDRSNSKVDLSLIHISSRASKQVYG